MEDIKHKKIGIFLGRLQPQHTGHERMIEQIFRENDEVVLCVGSAQKITESNPDFARNPLPIEIRTERLKTFLKEKAYKKPYRIVTAEDIEPDSAWPAYLKSVCAIPDDTVNTVYFADAIPKEYEDGMKKVGFDIKFIPREKFLYKTAEDKLHHISSATEIRNLEKSIENLNRH